MTIRSGVVLAAVLAVFRALGFAGQLGCSSSSGLPDGTGDWSDLEAGADVTGTPDGGTFAGDGGAASCGNPLDLAGCACTAGTPPRSCYPGPKAQAGVGACHTGQQSCVANGQGELHAGTWGLCSGAGQPSTCASAGAQCGTISDGCGGIVDCGSCSQGQTCGAGAANQCGAGACTPKTCADLGLACGPASDGCSGTLDCGSCAPPATCGGGGQPGQCGCVPTTCVAQGATCGTLSDNCGSTIDCGSCNPPDTCGGGGAPNTCGCMPTTCAARGANCGAVPDGCGGTLSCGTCNAPQTCGGGGVANLCGGGCTPTTCAAQGANCGSIPDGCGGTFDCGTCNAPQTCGGAGIPNQCGACTPKTCGALGASCGNVPDGCGGTLTCGTCTCPPIVPTNGGEDLFNNACGLGISRGEVAGSGPACQNFCNSFGDTLCCYMVGSLCYADNVFSDCQAPCWGNFQAAGGVLCQ